MDIAILKALEFIDRHLCDEFSLDDIAGIAGYSSFHFARKLKEETGKNRYGPCQGKTYFCGGV